MASGESTAVAATAAGELEALTLDKVAQAASAIDGAQSAGEAVVALHSLAVLLFSVRSDLVAGELDELHRSKVSDATCPTDVNRRNLWNAFYHGPAFPTLSRILLFNVAIKWLAHFPDSAREQLYDSFFVEGPSVEVIQALVPLLNQKRSNEGYDQNVICSNIERLLVQCFIEKPGVKKMIGELCSLDMQHGAIKPDIEMLVSSVAQLLASIPDRTTSGASSKLSPYYFFRNTIVQLLAGAEENAQQLICNKSQAIMVAPSPPLLFLAESISRICRRGSTGILVAEIVPRIRSLVQSCLSSSSDAAMPDRINSVLESRFWLNVVGEIRDIHSVERLSEELLRQLAPQNIGDEVVYWILWVLFNRGLKHVGAIRTMFVDKFIIWKVFPLCCLRWILQYSVLECPPNTYNENIVPKTPHFVLILKRLASIWSQREFVQSLSMEQQAYITAAFGMCLEKTTKNELQTMKVVTNSILEGISCRLESPLDLVRKMANAIALAFSKVLDPKKPLYLDDDRLETVNWEFGVLPKNKQLKANPPHAQNRSRGKEVTNISISDLEADEDDVNSDASSDSLEPYDLTDDTTDLQKKFTQLSDITVALRKTDDPDSVIGALDAADKLVRSSPDELQHCAGDLVRALVHLRCSEVAVDGEEDSAEEKRHKALIALLITCPFDSLDALSNMLYSASLDVGKRILILDVMTEAALELADSRTIVLPRADLISWTRQPWYMPSNRGPPGAGSWRDVSETGSSLLLFERYERELPSRPGQVKSGKSRKWSLKKSDSQSVVLKNRFPLYAAAFMLPTMQGFDKRRNGVDLLNRDFIVLGKLIYMLGVCMKCASLHPEASALAPSLLDMIKSREVSQHAEAYVRRSVLFAASCVLIALHPSYLASALIEGNQEISGGLEWIRTWAHKVAETDPDTECASMAVTCLGLHAELALQASRALESAKQSKAETRVLAPKLDDIIVPFTTKM